MGITYEHLQVKQARLSLPGDEGHVALAAYLNARAGIGDDEYGAFTGNEAIIIGDDGGGGCVLYGSPEEVAEALIGMADRLYPGISRMCVPANALDDADAHSHASASDHLSLPERTRMRQRAQYRKRMSDIMPAPWLSDIIDSTAEDLLVGAAAEVLDYDSNGQLDEEAIRRGHLLDPRHDEYGETSLLLIDDEEVVCELEQVRMRFDLGPKDISDAALPGK